MTTHPCIICGKPREDNSYLRRYPMYYAGAQPIHDRLISEQYQDTYYAWSTAPFVLVAVHEEFENYWADEPITVIHSHAMPDMPEQDGVETQTKAATTA